VNELYKNEHRKNNGRSPERDRQWGPGNGPGERSRRKVSTCQVASHLKVN